MPLNRAEFIKRCFIALAIALLPILVWYLFDVILIGVGALLLAELLGLGADPLTRWLRVPPRLALPISALVIFFAAQPQVYVSGLIQLFPPSLHLRAEDTIQRIGRALRLWLLGQLIQMVLIGVLSTIAVLLIGLPSPWALGLMAGIAEFVPFIGLIISAIPAVLVAATQSSHGVIW